MEDDYGSCFEWNSSVVTKRALFNLTIPCSNETIVNDLDNPGTFFVQAFRFGLALSLAIVVLALYNSVEVLGRTIFSTASCSVHWVLFMLAFSIRSAILVIFVPINGAIRENAKYDLVDDINYAGFTITYLLQLAMTFLFFISLEHEYKFRSADVHVAMQSEVVGRCGCNCRRHRLFLSWPRLIILVLLAISLLLFIVLWVTAKESDCVYVRLGLVWAWLAVTLLPRVAVLVMGSLLLAVRAESHRLTTVAKVCLVIGLALSLFEELPNSLLTVAISDKLQHCSLGFATLYDLVQLLGALSLVPLFFFVRSQYLRVEQECKLLVVWDIQKLLQVNGRRDVVF